MTERELRAVAGAIGFIIGNTQINDGRTPDYEDIAEAAITASDSKYVKGLVEALKEVMQSECRGVDMKGWITGLLQNLPEDLRK